VTTQWICTTVLGLGRPRLRLRGDVNARRRLALVLILAGSLLTVRTGAEEPKTAASIYNQLADDILMSPQTRDGARSRLRPDPQARTGYALVADPADKPSETFSDCNIWYAYTYKQGPGKIRGTFRLKVADNTVDQPVVNIRAAINNSDLRERPAASRELKGTDFAAPNVYQDFSLDLLKGEQGFAEWGTALLSNATTVSFDGLSVAQITTFDMAQLLEQISPPQKPAGVVLAREPFLVHETHGLYMELWGVRPAVGLLPEPLRTDATWTQSYLNVHPQRTALSGYPTKWEDLYACRAVVLNNVPAKAVTIVGALMLKDYVQDGGCVVLMGDTHSFAAGGWDKSVLAPLLPVTLAADGRVHPPAPLVLSPQAEGLRKLGLDWAAQPYTLYYHQATVKPEAQVLVAAGEVPLVVAGPAGQGRVVVLLNAVLGEKTPQAAGVPFWEWPDWPRLMAALLADSQEG